MIDMDYIKLINLLKLKLKFRALEAQNRAALSEIYVTLVHIHLGLDANCTADSTL